MPWKTRALFIYPVHLSITHPSIHLHTPIHPSTYLHPTHPHTPCLPTLTCLPPTFCPSTSSIYFPIHWNALSTQPHVHLPIHPPAQSTSPPAD